MNCFKTCLTLCLGASFTLPSAFSTYNFDPDPIQGLDAFAERQGVKPYDLFRQDEKNKKSPRLLYTDRKYGTQVLLLGDSPIAEHAITASVFPSWNADGSLLHLRYRDNDSVLFNADFSRKTGWLRSGRPMRRDANFIRWDKKDPNLYLYQRDTGSVYEMDVRTGKDRRIAQWPPHRAERIHLFPEDDRYLWVETPNGGLWMPYEPGPEPIGAGPWIDGRPAGPNPAGETPWIAGRPAGPNTDGSPHHPQKDAKNYRLWLPDKYRPAFPESEHGSMIRVRVGMRIDRKTGKIEKIIAPISSLPAYLKVFTGENGRLLVPDTPEWAEYRVHKADTVDEMYEIYRYYPLATHGHSSRSPDRNFEAMEGHTVNIFDLKSGDIIEKITVSPEVSQTVSHYHLHWDIHPRFFIGWVRGWDFVNYRPRENANLIYQGFIDGTWQPVFETKHRINSYYLGGDFSMLSPDATKIHTATNMFGLFRNIVAVMARPRPPENLSWQASDNGLLLQWQPSAYSNETRGWLVYRSEHSGDGYTLLTPTPVETTQWLDTTADPEKTYYYVVTSIEHSGLESGYSAEAARAGLTPTQADAPLVVYTEAELAIRDLAPTDRPGISLGRDRLVASDWYYIYLHPEAQTGSVPLVLNAPAAGEYTVWARVRGGAWTLGLPEAELKAHSDAGEWAWVRAGRVALPAGETQITLSTNERDAQLDLLALATSEAFEPKGARPEQTAAPAPVQALSAENIRERVNRLVWQPSADEAFSHYNVYASRSGTPLTTQEYLISSPVDAEVIDWGLKAGQLYRYAVTAVDRRGNESEPVFTEAATPARATEPVEIELAFADAKTTGKFKKAQAGGLRGKQFLLPEQSENRVEWDINIPHEGEYFLWLRYLPRGDGRRGNLPEQNIQVLLDGAPLMRLGGGTQPDGRPIVVAGSGPDLLVSDSLVAQGHPLAPHVWTWDRPASTIHADNPEPVRLPAGRHKLSLTGLSESIRYDVLLLTDEPSFKPGDGRLRGNN